jgi:hypothetical protein
MDDRILSSRPERSEVEGPAVCPPLTSVPGNNRPTLCHPDRGEGSLCGCSFLEMLFI